MPASSIVDPGRPSSPNPSRLLVLLAFIAVAALLARNADGRETLPTWLGCLAQAPLLAVWLRNRLWRMKAGPAHDSTGVVVAPPASSSATDLVLTMLVVTGAAVAAAARQDAALFFLATTVFIAGSLLIEVLADIYRRLESHTAEPTGILRVVIGPWLVLILVGTVALSIPLATLSAVPDYQHNFWLHVLTSAHAAVSSACLVGTTVYDFGREYTMFGQAVLVVITQLAGMAFAAIGLVIVRPFLHNVVRLRTILYLSFALQAAGILVMWKSWDPADAPAWENRLWWGLVHSSSAIWNSGLVLRPNGFFPYIRNAPIFASITTLAIIGSLGLPVILDLVLGLRATRAAARPAHGVERIPSIALVPWRRLPSWDTAFAFSMLLVGACLLFAFEAPWKPEAAWSLPESWVPQRPIEFASGLASLRDNLTHSTRWTLGVFISSTLRSAGLQSVSVSEGAMSWPSYGLFLLWMVIGGSAGGLAGGARTTALSILAVWLFSRKRTWSASPEGLVIRRTLLRSALAVLALCLLLNAGAVAALACCTDARSYEVVFDAVAACSGVGLSTGATLHLTWLGRIVIIVIMVVGRLVPVVCWLGVSRRITACLRREQHSDSGSPS